jgi:dTDP-4-dehydrorhamnose 3,5-epimerase
VIFTETALKGAFVIQPERIEDERGFFARTCDHREFAQRGLKSTFVQSSISFNKRRGTLRGMHYQVAPHEEVKLIRCTQGAIYDVIIDLRPGSPTFAQHAAIVLSAESRALLYVPEKFAHGFQTLCDNTEIFYQMTAEYAPDCARGVRWNDPAFAISWPAAERTVNARDRDYPDFSRK